MPANVIWQARPDRCLSARRAHRRRTGSLKPSIARHRARDNAHCRWSPRGAGRPRRDRRRRGVRRGTATLRCRGLAARARALRPRARRTAPPQRCSAPPPASSSGARSRRFERIGAAGFAERARQELQATGETWRRSDEPEQLTAQELQIALLVARGATNREAAASAFLSPKTVEAPLQCLPEAWCSLPQ